MAALLKDALAPNLVQTLENNPAFVHGGPFANIAHGCNSVIATKAALKLADYVITEAGFGADLGAEKFFDIKCRKAGLKPACAVIVATIRALKMHGGVAKDDLKKENVEALEKGFANLERHIHNLRRYDVPVIVSINRFSSDTEAELALLKRLCATQGVECVLADHWAQGGAGAEELARTVVRTIETKPSAFHTLYPDDMSLWDKTRTIAQEIYGAADITADKSVRDRFAELEKEGFGKFPICVAKTQYSFTTNPDAKGAPSGFTIPIREVRLSAGAEFVVVVCGDIMTMPGLPKVPAANNIELAPDGRITGLF
jgi:formate--tetrahydrofolate ligase